MSTVKSKKLQVGTDATASNNFTIYQPSTPDGTLRIGVGNADNPTEVAKVTNAGIINTSFPHFFGKLASNQTLTRATVTKITGFTSDEIDSASAFDGTTFTVPETGKYFFSAQLRVEQLAVNFYYQLRLTTSTLAIATIGTNGFDTTTPYFMLGVSVIVPENTGGTIKAQLFQSGTATSYVHTESYFCGMKLIGA